MTAHGKDRVVARPRKRTAQETINAEQLLTDGAFNKRIDKVEDALIQINHFTESIDKLDLATWKADISADVRWLKYLLGTLVLAVITQIVLQAAG